MQRDFTVLLPPAHRSSYTNKDQETMHRIRDPTFMIGTDKHTCLEEAAAIGRCECIESDCSESSANIRGPMFMNLDNSFEHVHQNLLHRKHITINGKCSWSGVKDICPPRKRSIQVNMSEENAKLRKLAQKANECLL